MTQTEAAIVVHCTRAAFARWEAGKRRMHPALWELYQIKLAGLQIGGATKS